MESLFKKRNNATDSGTSSTSTSSTTGQSSSGSKKSLSGGGIAGVTVGCVAGVGLIAGLAWFLARRHRKAKAASSTRLAWQSDASAIPPLESPQKELYGSGPEVYEMGVRDQARFEMPAENMAVEMPAEGSNDDQFNRILPVQPPSKLIISTIRATFLVQSLP